MSHLETERLILRKLTLDDAPFMLELVNDPDFLRYIGDKGVRTLEDARDYIRKGPLASYESHGFGLYMVERKADGVAVGTCGLLQRENLEHPDVGFAFLAAHRRSGYAFEAASAVLAHGRREFGMERILAIVSPENAGSIRLLEKLGLKQEGKVRMADDEEEIFLFGTEPRRSAPEGKPGWCQVFGKADRDAVEEVNEIVAADLGKVDPSD